MNVFQNWRSCRSCTSKCSFWGDWIWVGLLLWTQQDADPFRFAEYKTLSYSNISIYQNVICRKVIRWLLISCTETCMITLILLFRFGLLPLYCSILASCPALKTDFVLESFTRSSSCPLVGNLFLPQILEFLKRHTFIFQIYTQYLLCPRCF